VVKGESSSGKSHDLMINEGKPARPFMWRAARESCTSLEPVAAAPRFAHHFARPGRPARARCVAQTIMMMMMMAMAMIMMIMRSG
jgi:hypothetical protein